ncbi:kinase-like domain-containing protein [Fusarium tricinctum]|uniref:non-specific serine/threonine protein kinase n=1 Tax=Fusarium tricinctum TaxID=61284 RepID=A0A8K0RJ17_9HYPO|nr:kinase-like domain-containing protein [Fusarium tricinctum]
MPYSLFLWLWFFLSLTNFMSVNGVEIQDVLLEFFTQRFAHGKAKRTARSRRLTHVVWDKDPEGLWSRAERVFRWQPARLFLYGYTIDREVTELWLFSRIGIYRSEPILPGQLTLKQLITYYRGMTDFQLGLNPLIRTEKSGHEWILVKGSGKLESCLSDSPREYKLCLDKDPITHPREIVGNRPTVYRARDDYGGEFAVKFSVNKAQISHEERLLRRVTERKIWGVAQLVDFQTIEAGEYTSSCVVTSPFARDLESYHSIEELMRCFRDVIKGHYFLYHDSKILHRDISVANIMITNNHKSNPDAPSGILIDLDRSLDLETEPKKPYGLQGTRAFMSIGISLSYKDPILHTYRHDLESVFYVFLYLAVCRNKKLLKTSRLKRWMDGKKDWAEVGNMKREDMSDNENFNAIIDEFEPLRFRRLEALARELRSILFYPEKDFFVGTKTEAEDVLKLYNGMIVAFARWADRLDVSGVVW